MKVTDMNVPNKSHNYLPSTDEARKVIITKSIMEIFTENPHWHNDIQYVIETSWIMDGNGENLPGALDRESAFTQEPLIERVFEGFRPNPTFL